MPSSVNLISRNRLKAIPRDLRLAHEYCFFVHDECVRILKEYEEAGALHVSITFRSKAAANAFSQKADKNPISAMRACGYDAEARRVILNQITMAMASDSLHHIYEALRCLEKRKGIVALNLLRKPLTDSLMYLSWMFGDEDAFYEAFSGTGPQTLTLGTMGNRRDEILRTALARTDLADVLSADFICRSLFDRGNPSGLQKLFQHAVHLITVKHLELRTDRENFNFIFKSYADEDLYELLYDVLPHMLLYLSHVIVGLFDRVTAMDKGSKRAFEVRSILGLYLIEGTESERYPFDRLADFTKLRCAHCAAPIAMTPHNLARMVLADSYRCPRCRRVQGFPFSWLF